MNTQTTTPAPPLTAAHYRVGMEVEVNYFPHSFAGIKPKLTLGRGKIEALTDRQISVYLTEDYAPDREQEVFDMTHIRPVLRPVTQVTDAEWQVFWPGCVVRRKGGLVRLDINIDSDGDELQIDICPDGYVLTSAGFGHPASSLKSAELIDFLDSIGADCRGWLLDGRAVAKGVNGGRRWC